MAQMGGGEISIGTRVRKNIGGGSSYHPMGNRTAIDVPVFGSEPDWNQSHLHGQDLRIEALRCTDRRRNPGEFVNILHASTDLESSRDATDRLVSLMAEMGFNCQRRDGSYFKPIPPNKSARSRQWETRNRSSGLNKACLAAKGSLIRTAQTGHEIQADAQDSQD